MRNQAIYDHMIALRAAGISIIPVKGDKTPNAAVLPLKRKADGSPSLNQWDKQEHTWDDYQVRIATEAEIARWCDHPATKGVAVVGGAVSGGLLIFDFDKTREDNPLRLYEAWWQLAGRDVTHRLVWQKTGSGGRQAFLRCPNGTGNEKLAFVPDTEERSGRKVAIETRGEGGYAVVYPSKHPCGELYELLHGDLTCVPIRDEGEVEYLLDLARCLNEAPMEQKEIVRAMSRQKEGRDLKHDIIGRYRQETNLEEALKLYGYMKCGNRYLRPGATQASAPGVTVLTETLAYFHSTNDPMNGFRGVNYHDVFDLFMYYEHEGDLIKALEDAGRMYGMWNEPQPQERVEGQPLINKYSSFRRDPNIPVINTSARRSAFIPVSNNRRVNIATGEIF